MTENIIRPKGGHVMNLRLLFVGAAVLIVVAVVVLASTIGGGGGGGGFEY